MNLRPSAWGDVYLMSATEIFLLPGVVTAVNGAERPEEWSVQPGIGLTYQVTVWRRTNIADKVEVQSILPNMEERDLYVSQVSKIRKDLGKKPPVFTIANPHINFAKVTRVSVRNVLPPKWDEKLGAWRGTYIFIDYSPPKPVQPGPPDPPQAKTENARLADEIQNTVNEIAKAQGNP